MSAARIVSAKDMANRFAELLSEVQDHGVTIDIKSGNDVVARVMPATRQHGIALDRLDAVLDSLPHLASIKDADQFLDDVRHGRDALINETHAWDS